MIESMKEAQEAIDKIRFMKRVIEERKEIAGITELESQLAGVKKEVTAWAVETDTETIPLDGGGHAQLRRDKYGGTWITTSDDLDDAPEGSLSLWSVIRKKFPNREKRKEAWLKITRRVVDPGKLTQAVEEGWLTLDEVEPCYYEKEKAPYIRIYAEE